MGNSRAIWTHEEKLADHIARRLIGLNHDSSGWKIVLPNTWTERISNRKQLGRTRKNLLFTKRLAFDAAVEIHGGKDRALTLGAVDGKTREILRQQEKQGYYSEKIRKKQLAEIGLLADHYGTLMKSSTNSYAAMVKETYPTKKDYLNFLTKLDRKEGEVIDASLSTVRKGSKKERLAWFKKLQEVARAARMEELHKIFPDE
ncbi:NF038143 family protein [Thermodesulfobacteriota bacterium]